MVVAQVPTLDNFSVSPSTGVGARADAPAIRPTGAQQMQELGSTLTQVGIGAGNIYTDKLQQANQIRVDDAVNQAKQTMMKLTFDKDGGFTNLKGIDALERPEGKSLSDEYGQKFGTSLDDISKNLGNDAQRKAFAVAAGQMRTAFYADTTKHESDEFTTYALSVREGTIVNNIDNVGLNYRDPDKVDRSLASIKAAVYDQSRLLGKSAEWAEAQTKEMLSKAHRSALAAALQNNDLSFTTQYLDKYGKDMTADDRLAVEGMVDKETGITRATQIASEAFHGVSVEGRGPQNLQFPINGAIRSGFGARKAPQTPQGPGSTFHEGLDIAAKEGASVAAAGDGEVIYAGTRGGYGNLVRIRHADGTMTEYGHLSKIDVKLGQQIGRGDEIGLVGHTGKATGPHLHYGVMQNGKYVDPRGVTQVGASPGIGANASLLQMLERVQADPWLQAHPEWLAHAQENVRSLYSAREESKAETARTSAGEAYRALIANNGKLTPDIVRNLPDEALPSVMSFSREMSNQARVDASRGTPDAPYVYANLRSGIAAGTITSVDQLSKAYPKLGKEYYTQLVNDLTSLQSGDAKKAASYQAADAGLKTVQAEMRNAGLDWTPGAGDSTAASEFGKFQSGYYQEIDAAIARTGKPVTPQEARTIALNLLGKIEGSAPHFYSSNLAGYQLNDTQRRAARALSANGKPVTGDTIEYVIRHPAADISKIDFSKVKLP